MSTQTELYDYEREAEADSEETEQAAEAEAEAERIIHVVLDSGAVVEVTGAAEVVESERSP